MLIRKRNIKQFATNLFTPAFFVFTLAYLVIIWINYDKVPCNWDDFSHWADSIKAMVNLDDFITNPKSFSMFKSYPPAMGLFAYMFQKLYCIVGSNKEFCEWGIYIAYHSFFAALMMPFIGRIGEKRWDVKLVFSLILFALPIILYNKFYSTLQIDGTVGIMTGMGFAMIIFCREDVVWDKIYVLLLLFVLVLMKDVGLLSAIMIALAFVINEIQYCKSAKSCCKLIIFSSLAVFIPKAMWKYRIIKDGAKISFSRKIDFLSLINVLSGREVSYRTEVIENFKNEFFNKMISIGQITINYFALLVSLTLVFICVYKLFRMKDNSKNRARAIVYSFTILTVIIYVVGLCLLYMYKFSEYEAVRLASFERYLGIPYTAAFMLLTIEIFEYIDTLNKSKLLCTFITITAVASLLPWPIIAMMLTREEVNDSHIIRAPYDAFGEKICSSIESNYPRVLYINQNSDGFERWVIRYVLRGDCIMEGAWRYSVDVSDDDEMGKMYNEICTPDELREKLMNNYDYVVLHEVDEQFIEDYNELFGKSMEIEDGAIYKVNPQNGIPEKICS